MANLFSNSMILPLLVVATRSAGANTNQALPLILVASMSRSPMMAVVLAAALVRARTPPPPPVVVAAAQGPVLVQRGPAVVPPPQVAAFDPADFFRPFGMLSFIHYDHDQAAQLARWLGLNFEFDGDGKLVTKQDPAIGAPWPQDNFLKLGFGPRS